MDWLGLISPLTASEFIDEYWERRPARLGAARRERATGLLTLDDVDRLLADDLVAPELLSFNQGGHPVAPSRYCTEHMLGKDRRVRRVDLERVHGLLAEGHTMVLAEIQTRHAPLRRLVESMAEQLRGRVNANVYLTPAGHQGFGPHWDCHDVVIVQLHGRKRWRLYGSPHPLPLRGETFTRMAPSVGEPERELVLEPGDVLYVPRGHVHEAAAVDSWSLHVTLGVTVPRRADLLSEIVLTAAHEEVALRRAVSPSFVLGTADVSERNRQVRQMLRRLLDSELHARALAQLDARFESHPRPALRHRLVAMVDASSLHVDSVCGPRPGLRVDRDPEQGTVALHDERQALVLPEILEDELEFIATTPRFRIGDLPGGLEDEDKLALTLRLVQDGFLRCYGGAEARP